MSAPYTPEKMDDILKLLVVTAKTVRELILRAPYHRRDAAELDAALKLVGVEETDGGNQSSKD